MANTFIKLSLLAGTAIASAAGAAPQILYSSNPAFAPGAPVQGDMTFDGATQIRTDDGATIAFVGPARINVAPDGAVTVIDGHATIAAATGRTSVKTATGTFLVDRGSATLQVVRGVPSGRVIDGRMIVKAGNLTRNFVSGTAFTVNGSGRIVHAVTAGAQPVAVAPRPGTLIDQPRNAEQVLHNAVLLTGAPAAAGTVISDMSNPAFPALPAASVATLLEQSIALRDAAGGFRFSEASDALLAAQLAFLKSGGTAGAFTDTSAANVLSAYLDFLAKGGVPSEYGAAQSTLVAAYISYLQTVGLPADLSDDNAALLRTYFDVLAAGGQAFDQATVVAALDAYFTYLAGGGSPDGYSAISASLLKAYSDYLATIGGGSALAGDVAKRLAAYQALAAAGGGDFGAANAATLLASYLTYLRTGGSADGFTSPQALLEAYYNFLVAFGVPEGIDAATRQALIDYIAYVDAGGGFGTVPDGSAPTMPDPGSNPTPGTPSTGPGIGTSATVSAAAAVVGLFSGGPGDPGVINVAVDAQGRPDGLDYYGKPGTATLKEFISGNGYVLGRFGGGTFGSSGTYADNDGAHFAMLLPGAALPTSGSVTYRVVDATNPTLPGSSSIFARAKFEMTLGVNFGGAKPTFGYEGALTGTIDGAVASYQFASQGGSANPLLTNSFVSRGSLLLFGGSTSLTSANGPVCQTGCGFVFNAASGGAGFGVGYSLVDGGTNKAVINGAAVLSPVAVSSARASSGIVALAPSAGSATATIDGAIGWARWGGDPAKLPGADAALSGNQSDYAMWGAAATNLPTSGKVTYALAGATSPTTADGSATSGSFTGTLAVDFATAKVGLDSKIAIGGQSYGFASTGGTATPSMTLQKGADNSYPAMSFHGVTDAALGALGSVDGFLAGPGGNYAGLNYQATISGVGTVAGAAAFRGN